MNILICAQNDHDPHVQYVKKFIQQDGGKAIIFERYNPKHFLSFEFRETNNATLKINHKKYPLNSETFSSVWWRMKPKISAEISGGKSNLNEQFMMHEWKHSLLPFNYFLSQSLWMNNLTASQNMSLKLSQLKLAQEAKLEIPRTIVTNNHDDALAFLKKEKKFVYKTLSSFITEESAIYTNLIRQEDIQEASKKISLAPCIFQTLVKKDHELRVTVIDKEIFVLKINSQQREKTKLDWRYQQSPDMFSEGSLSTLTTKKLLNFHKKSGLIYAAYDFIVDQEGRELFLECNPGGQWLFKKNDTTMAIASAIAKKLLSTEHFS